MSFPPLPANLKVEIRRPLPFPFLLSTVRANCLCSKGGFTSLVVSAQSCTAVPPLWGPEEGGVPLPRAETLCTPQSLTASYCSSQGQWHYHDSPNTCSLTHLWSFRLFTGMLEERYVNIWDLFPLPRRLLKKSFYSEDKLQCSESIQKLSSNHWNLIWKMLKPWIIIGFMFIVITDGSQRVMVLFKLSTIYIT